MNRIIPYSFKGLDYVLSLKQIQSYNMIHFNQASAFLGEEVYSQFSQIFTNVLEALEENDQEYLSQIMEHNLFKVTSACLDTLVHKNIKLRYLNDPISTKISDEDSELSEPDVGQQQQKQSGLLSSIANRDKNYSKFPFAYQEDDMNINLDAKGVFGLSLNRKENEGRKLIKVPASRLATRLYYIDFSDPMRLFKNQILVLNVIFKTSRRLVAEKGEDNEIIYGDEVIHDMNYHKWRFESYNGELDWVLCDMDDYLKGNPYY